jgi:hypothetical protein
VHNHLSLLVASLLLFICRTPVKYFSIFIPGLLLEL